MKLQPQLVTLILNLSLGGVSVARAETPGFFLMKEDLAAPVFIESQTKDGMGEHKQQWLQLQKGQIVEVYVIQDNNYWVRIPGPYAHGERPEYIVIPKENRREMVGAKGERTLLPPRPSVISLGVSSLEAQNPLPYVDPEAKIERWKSSPDSQGPMTTRRFYNGRLDRDSNEEYDARLNLKRYTQKETLSAGGSTLKPSCTNLKGEEIPPTNCLGPATDDEIIPLKAFPIYLKSPETQETELKLLYAVQATYCPTVRGTCSDAEKVIETGWVEAEHLGLEAIPRDREHLSRNSGCISGPKKKISDT